ncbi:ras GTPase-activating protein-binding protein 2-like [Melia azedarach]|uniref:Ras GTPase-activating protein-binding protein 2-like n=1 Tax=Melia azedarach TaxID=155640 RepID=A0ACC1YY50_MELAZ|nr:ras GTPase-activating protein-binding protein 2-like [Melia azedarach]
MASPVQQAPPAPTADIVGNAFVHQYYLILHQSPQLVHRFYQDISKLGRPEENGAMSITTTMQAINDKILSLDYGEFSAEITTVDAQESYNGGVLVLVTGYLSGKDNLRRKFTQSFFLAPQDKGYFVLNDVFRYVDDANYVRDLASTNDVEVPITPEEDHSPVQENHVSDQTAILSEEVNGEVYNPSENGNITIEEEEAPTPEVVDAIPDDTHLDAESNSKVEEVPKKSYASIVKVMKDSAFSVPSPPPASLRTIMKSQEQQPASASPPAPASEKPALDTNVVENGNNQEVEGPSIYLKGLPPSATHALLENEFKKFGTIRSGGIQIKIQKGFCFGFVEFEEESAVQSAIESDFIHCHHFNGKGVFSATWLLWHDFSLYLNSHSSSLIRMGKASPIMISGHRVAVEPKKSTRGGNRGRFSSRAGNGYRTEGARGRGNYGGGRGYGRGDFGNRNEFENRGGSRGGFANRGGDGYQRNENGGRVNRAGRAPVNVAAKNVAPRVSAPA